MGRLGLFAGGRLAAATDHEQRPDTDVEAQADARARERAAEGHPATVERCVALLVDNTERGTPGRAREVMTPSRCVYAADLLRAGVPPNMKMAHGHLQEVA